MINENQEYRHPTSNIRNVLAGMVIGGLAGAVTMLLLAPQSGKDTRMQIQKKGLELRDRTSEMMNETMAQVRSNANKIVSGGREKIKELEQQGRKLAVEQLDRVSAVVDAGKTAVKTA